MIANDSIIMMIRTTGTFREQTDLTFHHHQYGDQDSSSLRNNDDDDHQDPSSCIMIMMIIRTTATTPAPATTNWEATRLLFSSLEGHESWLMINHHRIIVIIIIIIIGIIVILLSSLSCCVSSSSHRLATGKWNDSLSQPRQAGHLESSTRAASALLQVMMITIHYDEAHDDYMRITWWHNGLRTGDDEHDNYDYFDHFDELQ